MTTYKTMNRPRTILGAERRLFFVALISGGMVFSLLHSLLGGVILFIVGNVIARIATKYDVEIVRVLMNSTKFRRRYDPLKPDSVKIALRSTIRSNKDPKVSEPPHLSLQNEHFVDA